MKFKPEEGSHIQEEPRFFLGPSPFEGMVSHPRKRKVARLSSATEMTQPLINCG